MVPPPSSIRLNDDRATGFSATGNVPSVEESGRQTRGWIAAALVAALTLFVFFQLRYFGPESAVRRFHEAVLARNARQLASVSTAEVGRRGTQWIVDPETRALTTFLQSLLTSSPTVSFRDVKRQAGLVHVLVTYQFPPNARYPRGRKVHVVWVTTKRTGEPWRVDVSGTVRQLRPFG